MGLKSELRDWCELEESEIQEGGVELGKGKDRKGGHPGSRGLGGEGAEGDDQGT